MMTVFLVFFSLDIKYSRMNGQLIAKNTLDILIRDPKIALTLLHCHVTEKLPFVSVDRKESSNSCFILGIFSELVSVHRFFSVLHLTVDARQLKFKVKPRNYLLARNYFHKTFAISLNFLILHLHPSKCEIN